MLYDTRYVSSIQPKTPLSDEAVIGRLGEVLVVAAFRADMGDFALFGARESVISLRFNLLTCLHPHPMDFIEIVHRHRPEEGSVEAVAFSSQAFSEYAKKEPT